MCPTCSKSNTPWQRTTFLPLDFSFEIIFDKALVEIIFFINVKKLLFINVTKIPFSKVKVNVKGESNCKVECKYKCIGKGKGGNEGEGEG